MAAFRGDLFERFLHLVTAIFEAEGYKIVSLLGSSDVKTDAESPRAGELLIEAVDGTKSIAEVKFYRSRSAPVEALRQSVLNLHFSMGFHGVEQAKLVVGSRVSPALLAEFQKESPDIVIYDVDNLADLAGPYPNLARRLDVILRDALAFSDFRQPEPREADLPTKSPRPRPRRIKTIALDDLRKGAMLCAEIRSIPVGRAHAGRFERSVSEALEYIFNGDLASWSKQAATDTRISIYDLIANIASDHDFWKSIGHHFQSRYVVFELKNYGNRIKQGQIYTTEKYLYRAALRAIAIIISVKGPDSNALAAARGALREHGKLIVNLTIDDLCKMLHLKDSGDDHNSVIVDIVDEMLRKLER